LLKKTRIALCGTVIATLSYIKLWMGNKYAGNADVYLKYGKKDV